MNTKEVKEHYKVFFGKDIPEPHVDFFGSEFIEFCLYIAGKAAQQPRAPDVGVCACENVTDAHRGTWLICAACLKPRRR